QEGKEYIQRQGARPVVTTDPILLDVREKLREGKLDDARKVAEAAEASRDAVAAVALYAIEHRRFDDAEKMIQLLPEQGAAEAELRQIERSLFQAQPRLARTRENPQALLRLRQLQVATAFKLHHLSPEGVNHWRLRNGEAHSYLLYAPTQYQKDAGL